jgi:putative membrane protein
MWMWPGYGSGMGWMGFWMAVSWIGGLAILMMCVWFVARAAAGPSARIEERPEQILKRRYARGELNREEYEGRLADLRK